MRSLNLTLVGGAGTSLHAWTAPGHRELRRCRSRCEASVDAPDLAGIRGRFESALVGDQRNRQLAALGTRT